MLRFIARPQQYTLMPSVQLIHHHQAEQRDVINSETALTETTVNGKVSVLSVETTNHSCRMDKNAADMGVAFVRSRPCRRMLFLCVRYPIPVRA